jgi:chromosome segregation ATPase
LRLKFDVEQAQEAKDLQVNALVQEVQQLKANALIKEDSMRKELAVISAKVVALQEDKDRLTAECNAAKEQLGEALAETANKSETLKTMAVEKVDLERKVADLQTSLQLAQDSEQSFKKTARARSKEISRLRMEQQRAVFIINRHPNLAVSNDSRKILESVTYLLEQYDDLEGDYDQLKDDRDVMSNALVSAAVQANKVPELEAKASQLESTNTQLESANVQLESARETVATLEGNLESAERAAAEVPRLREMVAKLEGERDKYMHKVSSIRDILGRLGSFPGARRDEGPTEGGDAATEVAIKREP